MPFLAQLSLLLRCLRSWLDPRSRRPLILLAVIAFGVLLAPLAADEASAIFFAVPWSVRWWMGQASVVAAVAIGLIRLCHVRQRDAWFDPIAAEERSVTDVRMLWALRIAVAALVIPILANPSGLGFADWDFVLDKYEAIRRTVLIWRQFPWWNPWCRGGFPLAAEPQIGVVSPATPLVLAVGTGVGLRLAAILCVGIAVEGAYRLAWLWFREPWSAAAAAIIYGCNGAVSVSLATGYIIAMSYGCLPWLVYHALRIGEGVSQGVRLGFWMAFAVLNGIQYLTLYAVVLAAAAGLRAVRMQPAGRRIPLVRGTVAAAGVFSLLSGWRLATMWPVLAEDRREAITLWDESLPAVLRHLLTRPTANWPEVITGQHWAAYVSLTTYVGPVVVALAVMSLLRGWRWWHTLVVIAGWLAIGSRQWYHPSYWLFDWPFLGAAHVVTRWRFLSLLGLGLAAASVLARWRRSGRPGLRTLAVGLTLVIAADFGAIACEQLPRAFSVAPMSSWFPGPPVRGIVNVGDGLGYACVLRGYGVIRGYEPMLSYHRDAPTLRTARGEPGYRGEAWTSEGEVQPIFWSPNRLVFAVRPGQEVFINQNPGSWWRVNGRRAFAGRRCAEMMVPFSAVADANGRLVLEIDPPGLGVGILLHAAGAILLAAALGIRRHPG